jgi:hypothetical protein
MTQHPTEQSEHTCINVPCFFFSYARKDCDKYLKRFFEDLSNEVSNKEGLDRAKGQVSFRDLQDIEPGDDWEHEIADALQHSPVLVSVYTTWYFTREYCGKEFYIFLRRDPNVYIEDDCFRNSKNIIPLFWRNKRDLSRRKFPPKNLSFIQVFDPDPEEHDENKKRGLRQILVNSGGRGKYIKFINYLADKILDLYKKPLKPLAECPILGNVPSIFHDTEAWHKRHTTENSSKSAAQKFPVLSIPDKGLRLLLFSYAAIDGDEALHAEIAETCSLLPFPVGVPPLESGERDIVGITLDAVASRRGFDCQEIIIDTTSETVLRDIVRVIQKTIARNAIPVLIIGQQTNTSDVHTSLMEHVTHIPNAYVIVLLLLNRAKDNLRPGQMRGFPEINSEQVLVEKIDVQNDSFETVLGETFESLLFELMRRILVKGNVKRSVEFPGPTTNPLIDGPSSRRRYE